MAADVEAACTEACLADQLEAMRTRLEHYLQAQGLLSHRLLHRCRITLQRLLAQPPPHSTTNYE
jgi:hypothetical protein